MCTRIILFLLQHVIHFYNVYMLFNPFMSTYADHESRLVSIETFKILR